MKKRLQQLFQANRQAGFTVIELLVVLVVMVSIGMIIGNIFFITLRSANKSNKVALVRQNGNAAITQISRKIRYATDVSFTNSGGTSTNCTTPPPPYSSVTLTNTKDDGTTSTTNFSCPVIVAGTPNALHMVTTNPVSNTDITDSQVSRIKTCSIVCYKQASGSVTVAFLFDMTDNNDATGLFENTVAPIHFETSVTMRNIQR